MSRLGRLIGATEQRDISPSDLPFYDGLQAGGMSTSGVSVTTDSAFRHADVYACIRVISDACASIPLHMYRRSAHGRDRVDPTKGRPSGVWETPAPALTQAVLISTMAAHLNLHGEAFVAKLRDEGGRVVQLQPISPYRISAVLREAGEPIYLLEQGDGSTLSGRFQRSDILHVRGLSLDGLRGVSPIAQARDALGVGMALEEAAGRDFANGTYPGGVVEVPGQVSDPALKRFRKAWQSMHRGAKNRGRVAFLEEGWTYKPLGMPAKDAQFVEQRQLSATQIARIFRVPPYMIGAPSGSSMTYSTVEGELMSFLMHTVRPWLVYIEQAINADDDLRGDAAGDYVEFLLDAFLRADTQVRYLAYQQADFMKINEKRQREGLPDVEGGEVVPAIERLKQAAAVAAQKEATP